MILESQVFMTSAMQAPLVSSYTKTGVVRHPPLTHVLGMLHETFFVSDTDHSVPARNSTSNAKSTATP